jgi:hypothetical protein
MVAASGVRHRRFVAQLASTGPIPTPPAERRGGTRHSLWFPVQIDGDELGTAVGISKDVSVKGALVQTHFRFAIGAPV